MSLPEILDRKPGRWGQWRIWLGLLVLVAAAFVFIALNPSLPRLAIFWIFGLAFGYALQRSQLCFVSGFSNFYLFRHGQILKAILGGMALATIGFALIMYQMVPDPGTGEIPINAHASPFGWHLVLAGVMFGLGMVLAGNCMVGTLYRIGEGAVSALVALLGIMIGLGFLLHSWGWWWPNYISQLPRVWLPQSLGWPGAVLLALAVLGLAYLLVHRRQPRSKMTTGQDDIPPERGGLRARLARGMRAIFVSFWPVALGGVILGGINIFEYWAVDRPWGITGEFSRWSSEALNFLGLPVEVMAVPGT